jgi:hypothetical protein
MKVKHILFLFLLCFVFITLGAFLKLNYIQGADILMNIGLGLKLVAIIATIYKLVKSPKFKALLNS